MTPGPRDVRTWLARTKAAPARIDRINAQQESVVADLEAVLAELRRVGGGVDQLHRWLGGVEERLGWTAGEVARVRQVVEERALVLDGALTAHAAVLRRVATSADRRRAFERLVEEHGPPAPLRPGLSTFTVTWNHAGFLEDAVRSGLAALDAVPAELQGEVLVVDDGSVDETPAILERLHQLDDRVRSVRAPENLGLGLGRNLALHLATTSHAFQLDADNTAEPPGVAALFDVARRYEAALVYGTVLKVDAGGRTIGVMSNEPITPAFFGSNYVDTMAVVDVDVLRGLGGWPADPVIEHVDDWAATHALLRHGHLGGFVPEVAGRYRDLAGALHASTPDPRLGDATVRRMWNSDGRLASESVAAFAAHPVTGPLWATPAAAERRPDLAPVVASDRPAETSDPAGDDPATVLVVGSGGVGNVGDDAITVAVVDRLRLLLPRAAIEVVTDGDDPVGLRGALWRGTLGETVRGLPVPVVEPERAAAVVFAGGGSITSEWTSGLIEPRAALARRLGAAGVPYVMSGQGIGPLADEHSRRLVAGLVAGAEAVALRDPRSAALCAAIGTGGPALTVTGDDALLLSPIDSPVLDAHLAASGVTDQPYVAMTVRVADYVGDHDLEQWADVVDRYAAARDLTVLGVALNDMGAEPELVRLATLAHGGRGRRAPWRLVACERDPRLLAGVLARAEAAAVHSYHAALFALAAGKPAVLAAGSEYYRQKAHGLAALAGLPDDVVVDPTGGLRLDVHLDAVASALRAGAGLSTARRAVDDWWHTVAAALLPSATSAEGDR